METNYATNEWELETTVGRRIFIYNYAMRGNELSGWDLVKSVVVSHEPEVTEKVYLWKRRSSEDEMIHVSVIETGYWAHAQQYLKAQLEHCMRPDIPRGTSKTASIGDIQYLGPGADSKSVVAVFFSRGNLQVNVRSAGKKPVDVVKFAKDLDERFMTSPTATAQKAGAGKRLRPATVVARKNRKSVLVDPLPERISRSGWLRVSVPDGELRREGDVLYYTSDTAGKKSVQILNLSLE